MIKRSLHFLINTLLITLIFVCTSFPQSDLHRLKIISEKPFELFVNDFSIGSFTEFDTLLKPASYKVEVYLIDTAMVKSIFKKNLLLDNDKEILLDTIYPATIKSYPDDAEVYFDSIYFGSTPLKLNLLFKPSFLDVKKPGYKSYTKDISNLDKFDFYIKLEREEIQRRKFNIDYKYVALTSTIINGAFAAYTKQLANKYFYKSNRSNEDMQKVKTYDRYSGFFTIAMEISFGIFVYLLFQE